MGEKKVKCLKCNDIIESMHRHDFVWCSCGNIFIDGGNDYMRFGGRGLDDDTFQFIDKGDD
jgi:hypothetical protein